MPITDGATTVTAAVTVATMVIVVVGIIGIIMMMCLGRRWINTTLNTTLAAELAPGMVEAQVEGVGPAWISSAEVKGGRECKHPPLEPELRDFIE